MTTIPATQSAGPKADLIRSPAHGPSSPNCTNAKVIHAFRPMLYRFPVSLMMTLLPAGFGISVCSALSSRLHILMHPCEAVPKKVVSQGSIVLVLWWCSLHLVDRINHQLGLERCEMSPAGMIRLADCLRQFGIGQRGGP